MKKVGIVLTPVEFGGAEKVSLTLLKHINREEFSMHPIVFIRPWEEGNLFLKALEAEDYDYMTIPVALYERCKKRDCFRVMRCCKLLSIIVKRERFDVIHTNGYLADIIGIPVARMLGIPIVSTCHGFITNDVKLWIYTFLDQRALLFANRIIAVSDDIKYSLIKAGIKESIIEVIQNSVETHNDPKVLNCNRKEVRLRFNLLENEMIVGYVGRLSEEKGIRFLIEAISILDQRNVPVKLLLFGDGPQRSELERYVQEKKIEDRIFFMGFKDQIEKWLPALDVFVLPSLTEGTPMALLEAMAQGLPTIASGVGGIPSIVHSGRNGMLTQPRNPQEIADTICTLYENVQLRVFLGTEAKKTIRANFNVADWAKKMEAIYISLTKGDLM